MKSIKTVLIAALFAVFLFGTKTALADNFSGQSSNWAGYITENGSYTGISGSWIMPQISYSSTLASNATWVGIGGRTSEDLIQAGVYEIANADGATYQAWYEMLPNNSIPVNLPVYPGDSISVAILETSPDTWNIVINNNTTNQQFEQTVTYDSSLSSAEWIQERPVINNSFSNLSGFSTVQFTGATVVANGQRISLAQSDPQVINMIDTPTGYALAVPSAIDSTGTSFTVSRTSATVSPDTSVVPVSQSYTPPSELHRTGHYVIPVVPGITWVINFLHNKRY
jgi:hypothetical protein